MTQIFSTRAAPPRGKSLYVLTTALALCAGLAGCSTPGGDFLARSGEPMNLASAPLTGPVSERAGMIVEMPAPYGAVRRMREKVHANGVWQQAVLDDGRGGQGENHLEISVLTRPSVPGGLALAPPDEAGIRREILARYPRLGMRIVTQPRQNGLGVYGLAIGRAANGARCVFAWQWAENVAPAGAGGPMPASLRVHMCRKGATVDELADAVSSMTLAAPAIVAQALDPARAPTPTTPVASGAPAGAAREAIAAGTLEAALGPAAAPAPETAARVRFARAPRKARVHFARRRTPVREAQESQEGIVVARQPVAQALVYGGPRYLAPSAAPAGYSAPAYGGGAVSRQLDASLPAAAYRGPTQ